MLQSPCRMVATSSLTSVSHFATPPAARPCRSPPQALRRSPHTPGARAEEDGRTGRQQTRRSTDGNRSVIGRCACALCAVRCPRRAALWLWLWLQGAVCVAQGAQGQRGGSVACLPTGGLDECVSRGLARHLLLLLSLSPTPERRARSTPRHLSPRALYAPLSLPRGVRVAQEEARRQEGGRETERLRVVRPR